MTVSPQAGANFISSLVANGNYENKIQVKSWLVTKKKKKIGDSNLNFGHLNNPFS